MAKKLATKLWVEETIKTYGDLLFSNPDAQWACLFITLDKLKAKGYKRA